MNSRLSMMRIVAAVALAAGVSGIARADDSSSSRFGGDGYAYFHQDKPIVSKAPTGFRQSNPNGLSESQLQALSSSSVASAYGAAVPAFDKATSSFAQSHPHGLSVRELQALSSEGPAWHSSHQSAPSARATMNDADFANRAAK